MSNDDSDDCYSLTYEAYDPEVTEQKLNEGILAK